MKLGKYRHFKGNEYEVLAIANHSETMEKMKVWLEAFLSVGMERLLTAAQPQAADIRRGLIAANDGDLPVSQGYQGIDGAAGSFPVIGGNTGEIGKAKL